MERFKDKKILIVGVGQTGFTLINFFNSVECDIRVTDIKPIFDLNKAVKKLKKFRPVPQISFGEHKDEDFLDADVIVYSPSVNPNLPQLQLARDKGKEVYSEFDLANKLCRKPIIAVCGSKGRSTVAHMLGYALRLDGKNVFVGGTSESSFINFSLLPNKDEIDWVIVEVSAVQMKSLNNFHPKMVVFTNINERYDEQHFSSVGEYIERKLSIIKTLGPEDYLIVSFDSLSSNSFFRNAIPKTYWYSRRSFVKLGVINDVQGTHFHNYRIHSNIHYHSEVKVSKMRIIGAQNRENLLAAITAAKALKVSDEALQETVEKFPGIPHRLEFLMEKNGVSFYNDSKSISMKELSNSLKSFKNSVILIAGGKEDEEVDYEIHAGEVIKKGRVVVLIGENKERLNRALVSHPQTFIVGSFEESILLAYQKSRTGDIIVLSPGADATDFFRDYKERGSYFKKLVYQL